MESEYSRPVGPLTLRSLERIPIEIRLVLLGILGALPAVTTMLILLPKAQDLSFALRWAIGLVALVSWICCTWLTSWGIRSPLSLIAATLRSFQEGDYSTRLVKPTQRDGVSDTIDAINALGDVLREQRLGATEAVSLLKAIMEEVDLAIFTVDPGGKITWINRAGASLVRRSPKAIIGQNSSEMGLDRFLLTADGDSPYQHFSERRLAVKRRSFFEGGRRHTLVVVSDLTDPLREEERSAWHRVIRVLSHEINNSLTPIRTLSVYLIELLEGSKRPADWEEDLRLGLGVLAARAEALARFVAAYAQMAKLPPPRKVLFSLAESIRRMAMMERRVPVIIEGEGSATMFGDPDQLEQALINLIRNAAEASLEVQGGVTVSWHFYGNELRISVRDEGSGLTGSENLFVPFFTTKDGGSGIGLALSRQIIDSHGGTLTLRNRSGHRGCEATISLPLR